MGDMAEDWKEAREAQKRRREERLPAHIAEILALVECGYTIQKLTDYQFRVNGKVDLFPIHRRWHNIRNRSRGMYNDLKKFLEGEFARKDTRDQPQETRREEKRNP